MVLSDLKVVSANIQVDNSREVDAKYKISATFRTSEGAVNNIDGGNVMLSESNERVATFNRNYNYEESLHVGYYKDAVSNEEMQVEINRVIIDFVNIAINKAVEETNE